jgi:hypothetical protein
MIKVLSLGQGEHVARQLHVLRQTRVLNVNRLRHSFLLSGFSTRAYHKPHYAPNHDL